MISPATAFAARSGYLSPAAMERISGVPSIGMSAGNVGVAVASGLRHCRGCRAQVRSLIRAPRTCLPASVAGLNDGQYTLRNAPCSVMAAGTPTCAPTCPQALLPTSPFAHKPACPRVPLSTSPYAHASTCPRVHLPMSPLAHESTCPRLHLPTCRHADISGQCHSAAPAPQEPDSVWLRKRKQGCAHAGFVKRGHTRPHAVMTTRTAAHRDSRIHASLPTCMPAHMKAIFWKSIKALILKSFLIRTREHRSGRLARATRLRAERAPCGGETGARHQRFDAETHPITCPSKKGSTGRNSAEPLISPCPPCSAMVPARTILLR